MHEQERERRANRDRLIELGVDPHGGRVDDLVSLSDARSRYDEDADTAHQASKGDDSFVDRRPVVRVGGRVMLLRDNGKLIWLNLRDETGTMQVAVSKRDCSNFEVAQCVDLGDIVVADGPLMKTRTGEITIWASSVTVGTKAIAPPPEKHAGLQDTELRYRRRYVDLWSNAETMSVFQLRSRLVTACRHFMDAEGFVEVETPMLQTLAGGAAARPFETHLRALDIALFLRIAPELYLKRLLVGGMSKVYELNRNFRNEGVDRSHNPEFTVLEVYEAFGDYMTMLDRTERLIRHLATEVGGGGSLPFGEMTIDYASPFHRVTYGALFEDALGYPMTDVDRARADAKERKLKHEGLADILVVNELFEAVAEPLIDPERPTFVLDYPAALSPLTKAKRDDPETAERWDLFIGGMEIGPAYTELNDPDVQLARFEQQLQGLDDEESTFRTLDADFIEALKVGMPPAGGLGLGIDRLVMLLSNQRSIRDVLLFPFMRPLD